MIKTHYAELLSDAPGVGAKAEWLAARTWELTDFLVNVVGVEHIDSRFDGSITYHDSCAGLREMGVKNQPRELLARVEGLTIREMEGAEQCCGFGGTFAIKFGDISARLADLKCDDVEKSEADALVLGDLGCMLNIEGRLRRRGDNRTKVLHVAEVLAGLSGEEAE
jgi:L-lactate dehydrogenase complex protein LldE